MNTCFITPAVLKVLKIGEQRVNYYKIYDNSDLYNLSISILVNFFILSFWIGPTVPGQPELNTLSVVT